MKSLTTPAYADTHASRRALLYCAPTSSCVVFSGWMAENALTDPAGPMRGEISSQ
jgi:hypothetical protein